MEKSNNNENQKKLFALLKELSEVQKENMKLSFVIRAREARDAVENGLSKFFGEISKKAKQFGSKAQKLADDYLAGKEGATAIKEYEAAILALESEYEEGLRGISEEKAELQVEEQEAMLEVKENKAKRKQATSAVKMAQEKILDLGAKREELLAEIAAIETRKTPHEEIKPFVLKIKELKAQVDQAKAERKEAIDNDDEKADKDGKKKILNLNRQIRRYRRKLVQTKDKLDKQDQLVLQKLYKDLDELDMKMEQARIKLQEKEQNLIECRKQVRTSQNKLYAIRGKIEACENKEAEYIETNMELINQIGELKADKEEQKALMPKQNIWQKMAGFFVNKFNGAAKFNSKVIGVVKKQTVRIVTEKIPEMGKGIATATSKTIGGITEKYQNMKQSLIEKAEAKLETATAKQENLQHKRDVQKGLKENTIPDEEADL